MNVIWLPNGDYENWLWALIAFEVYVGVEMDSKIEIKNWYVTIKQNVVVMTIISVILVDVCSNLILLLSLDSRSIRLFKDRKQIRSEF